MNRIYLIVLVLSVLYLRSLLLGVSKPTGGFSLGNFYVPPDNMMTFSSIPERFDSPENTEARDNFIKSVKFLGVKTKRVQILLIDLINELRILDWIFYQVCGKKGPCHDV